MRYGHLRAGLGVVASLGFLLGATAAPSAASGLTRIQQSDGTVQTYPDAHLRLRGNTLWITSADKRGVLEVVNGACSYAGELQRCLTGAVTLHQHGLTHAIAIEHGTVYLNLTPDAQTLPHSGDQLAPHDVLVAFRTQRGTFVSVRGTLDEVSQ